MQIGGMDKLARADCGACKGNGKVARYLDLKKIGEDGRPMTQRTFAGLEPCAACGGSGKL